MGNVYLAITHGPGGFHKLFAVKELRPDFADDAGYVTMFFEEARFAARLTHPNIVQTNEVGSDGDRHYMVMEYLDGRSLYRVIRHMAAQGGLPLGAHLRVIAETLLGLHHAHELRGFDEQFLSIVHRDVSPPNVFVTFDGQAKLLDFGIAKAADSCMDTRAGVLKGRIAYMAPEQVWSGNVDRRADLYAMGVMIWEAVAGRRLWAGLNDVEILARTQDPEPPRLASACPEAPAELDALCARAMARDPDQRHATAVELLAELDSHLCRRDDAPTMRELGAMVAKAFETERRQLGAVVEDAVGRARTPPHSAIMSTARVRPLGAPPHRRPAQSIALVRSTRPTRPELPVMARSHRKPLAWAAAALLAAVVAIGLTLRNGSSTATRDGATPLPTLPALAGQAPPAIATTTASQPLSALAVQTAAASAGDPGVRSEPHPAPVPASSGLRWATQPRWTRPATAGLRGPGPDTGRAGAAAAEPSASPAPPRPDGESGTVRPPPRAILTNNPYGAP
jgi:serine/threonine-protein kinase